MNVFDQLSAQEPLNLLRWSAVSGQNPKEVTEQSLKTLILTVCLAHHVLRRNRWIQSAHRTLRHRRAPTNLFDRIMETIPHHPVLVLFHRRVRTTRTCIGAGVPSRLRAPRIESSGIL